MITGYFRFEKDPSKKVKYICTKVRGNYKGLEYFRSRNGDIVLFLSEARTFVKADVKRSAQWALVNRINFSSIFISMERQGFIYGYGNPNKSKLVKGKPNPMAQYVNDLYLFIISKDLLSIEILVISQGIHQSIHFYNELVTGCYDAMVTELRECL